MMLWSVSCASFNCSSFILRPTMSVRPRIRSTLSEVRSGSISHFAYFRASLQNSRMSSQSSYSPHLLKTMAMFSAYMLFKVASRTLNTQISAMLTLCLPSITTSTKSIASHVCWKSLYRFNHCDIGMLRSPSPGLSVSLAFSLLEYADLNSYVIPESLLLAANYYSVAASVGSKSTDIAVDLPAPSAPTTKMCLDSPVSASNDSSVLRVDEVFSLVMSSQIFDTDPINDLNMFALVCFCFVF